MRPKSLLYPSFLVYELLRLVFILIIDSGETGYGFTQSWYAAAPLLVLAPMFFLMLSFDEARFSQWLPLASLIKALSVFSLLTYLARTIVDLISSGSISAELDSLAISLFIVLADAVLGVYCFGRNRILCR